MVAPMNTRPDDVIIGPPIFGVPILSARPPGARSCVVPMVWRQTISPVSRLMPAITPQGGGVHGRPSGDISTPRVMP